MKRNNLLFCVVCLVWAVLKASSVASEETFVATLDRDEISLDQVATLTLSLKVERELEISPPLVPPVQGLSIFYREKRNVLSPQGGKVSPSTEFVYTLSPETAGEKVIPPLGIHVSDRLLFTKPMTLKVVSNPSESPQGRTAPPASSQGDPLREATLFSGEGPLQRPKAFARVSVESLRPYLYEPIRVTLWVYATVPFQLQGLKEEPDNKNWTEVKELKGEWVPEEDTETREGETYAGRIVGEQIWIPQKTGPQLLQLGELTLSLKSKAKNLFDRSFQEELPAGPFRSQSEPFVIRTDPIALEVQPLPEEKKPDDFSGAVGDFKVSVSLDKTEVELGESVTLKFQILGKGNVKQMKEPSFEKFPFATSFQPRSSEAIRREKLSFRVEKTFEVILIPTQEGNFTIHPPPFSYFNPKFRGYRKITPQPISLTIREKAKTALAAPKERELTEPELLGKDIYYLKKELGSFYSPTPSLLSNPVFLGFQGLPLLALLSAFLWRSYRLYLFRNEAAIRRRRAFQTSQVHLKKAQHYFVDGKGRDFAREAQEALLGYLSDKTGILKGGLTLDRIDSLIQECGGGEGVQKSVRECLEALQAVQFASSQVGLETTVRYETVKEVLELLDQINLSTISKKT